MVEENKFQKENISDALSAFKESRIDGNQESHQQIIEETNKVQLEATKVPKFQDYEKILSEETDPDLKTVFEIIKLPSKGLFYENGVSELMVEYMTSKDEDLLTTPSLIESGRAINLLLQRKIKNKNINPDDLLDGDRSAIILSLRISSYGSDYTVNVVDPRTGIPFKANVDLSKLEYKEISELPDENGYFVVEIPMRKKIIKFRLLTSGEELTLFNKSEALKDAYGSEVSEFNTLKLKTQIVSIDGNTDRTYISKFVDAMPALDALTIRKKIIDVSPDVDMNYEFTANDGYKFKSELMIGVDFFFPAI